MPVRAIQRSNRRSLPRRDLVARRVTTETLDNGYFSDGLTSFEEFPLKVCTVQPAQGEELETLGEGYKGLEAFNIFTQTRANPAIEGTDKNPDEVFLSDRYASDPGWFLVMTAKPWRNQVIPHYHLLVVRKNDK